LKSIYFQNIPKWYFEKFIKKTKGEKMKKKLIFFFVVLLLTASQKIFAQFIDENFEYNTGDLISNYGWVPFSGIGINPIKVVAPGLDYPCYGCIFGNAAQMVSTGEDVYKFLTRPITTGSFYVSLMVKIDSAQTGDVFFHIGDSVVNNSNKVGQVYAKDSSGKVAFGLAKSGNNNEIYTPARYFRNITYLLVLKYQFVAGSNNDLVSLFVITPPDCAPSVEPPPTLGPIGGSGDLANVGKVVLEQGAGSKGPYLVIDGICAYDIWNNSALPVELSAFSSSVLRNDVTLNWVTNSERNNSGFKIERKSANSDNWNVIGNVDGMGTSSISHHYIYKDGNLSSGKYNYRLKQMDLNGNFEYFNLNSEVGIGLPVKFELSQNYPNPFNPSTSINYDLPNDGFVKISVFDMSGKEVASLVNGNVSAGYNTVTFNASNLSSGIYYYKLETAGFTKVMKMALVK
jgi:Secretion system C-terminal sorting domain